MKIRKAHGSRQGSTFLSRVIGHILPRIDLFISFNEDDMKPVAVVTRFS